MAAITWTDVTDLAASLSAVPVARQTAILAYVNTRIPVTLWGGEDSVLLFEGRINLAAHMGSLSLPGAAGAASGPVTRVEEGDAKVEFASLVSLASASSLDRTSYGSEYRRLGRTTGGRVMGGCP